jgi:DNA polymerase I-like protein with 3'-5' exonuclease and polymerase domains
LQNVDRGPLRSCFVPSAPDRSLIIADYSQIELRVVALIANETVMIDAFRRGEDLHRKITAINLGKDPVDVTRQERATVGKSTNFGFAYGQRAKGFASYARAKYGLNLSIKEAEAFRRNYRSTYPAIPRWHTECERKSANPGNNSARIIMGRLLLAKKDDAWSRFNLFTEYVVSGSCADLIKAAMIKADSVLPAGVHLVATVHDELVYDAPADVAPQCRDAIRQAMIETFVAMFGTEIPVEVEAKVCANWGEK